MSITSTDPKQKMCCVLVYNDGYVIAQQCNRYQQTSTSFNLETFSTMKKMQERVDELGLKYREGFEEVTK